MKAINKTVLAIACCTALAACSSEKKSESPEQAVKVEVYSPTQSSSEGIYLSGELTAKQTASISTRMMGYIRKIYAKPGDRVSAGQLLVSISSDEVSAKKAQVQAMIAEAEAAAKKPRRFRLIFMVMKTPHGHEHPAAMAADGFAPRGTVCLEGCRFPPRNDWSHI